MNIDSIAQMQPANKKNGIIGFDFFPYFISFFFLFFRRVFKRARYGDYLDLMAVGRIEFKWKDFNSWNCSSLSSPRTAVHCSFPFNYVTSEQDRVDKSTLRFILA